MARNVYRVLLDAEFTTTADSAYHSVVEGMATATTRFSLLDFWVSFRGIASTGEPIIVQLIRITAGGTATAIGSTYISKLDEDLSNPTVKSTWKRNHSVEPTLGQILHMDYVHPQGKYVWPLGHQRPINVAESKGIALRLNQTTGQTAVKCLCGLTVEE